MEGRELEYNVKCRKLEKERDVLKSGSVRLSANSSFVNAGMRERCSRSFISKGQK